jgi:radical SAM protein with 4Fe4S-binding SPASM domain
MGATTQLGIHSDGTVVPCCLDNNATIKLGNVKDHSLREIITHERADRMRSGLDEAKLVEEMCQRCEFASRFRKKIRYRR